VNLNIVMQIGLVAFTALGFLFTSMKLPHYGVAANLVGQIFWLYSSYRAWREADQIGRGQLLALSAIAGCSGAGVL